MEFTLYFGTGSLDPHSFYRCSVRIVSLSMHFSIAVHRFNSVLLHVTLIANLPDSWLSSIFVLASVFIFNPGDLY